MRGTGTGTGGSALRLAWQLALLLVPPCLLGLGLGCNTTPTARFQAQEEDEHDKDLGGVLTIGDVTDVGNVTPVPVSGVGLVVGLEGTGGAAPPSYFRDLLLDDLRKQKVPNPRAVLESPENSMALVSGLIPPGARRGDPIDIEVYLPQGGKATSLRGGYLRACALENYASTKQLNPNTDKGDHLVRGHIVGRAQGPVLAGLGAGDDDAGQRKGHIWEGGVSFIDRPFLLLLKNDQQFAKVANAVAQRINSQFQDDPERQMKVLQHRRLLVLSEVTDQINETFGPKVQAPLPGKGDMATAFAKSAIEVRVPWQYRLNPEHYLLVVRHIPLREVAPDVRNRYRQKLQAMLLDPAKCVRAAVRLEALGKGSIPGLKAGLKSDHPLVRFCAAESLTYLGSPSGAEELAGLARQYDSLRAPCLMALAGLDEPVCREKLTDLLESPVPELRYGAFRALRLLDETDPHVRGQLLNRSFWVHCVEPQSPPLVHFSLGQRAEVVLFGSGHRLVPPLDLRAQEFTIKADASDDRCAVCRFMVHQGRIERRLCSLNVEDVLRTMAELGAQYPDVVELLRRLDSTKTVSCRVCQNALPGELPVQELAALGRNAEAWRVPAADGEVRQAGHTAPARP
jgi:hypothetical protein